MPKTILLASLLLLFILVPGLATHGQAQQALLPPLSQPAPGLAEFSPSFTGCGGQAESAMKDAYEQSVVELVNAARAEHGLPPLKRSAPFEAAARYHAADLGQDDYFDHSTYDREAGKLVYICSAWDRIASYTSGAHAENAAAGYSTPQAVMDGWMGSAGHRSNILNPSSREIGVGYSSGSGRYNVYWVQDFGAREGVYPLVINRESGATDQRSVSLFIHGAWEIMRLRNDAGGWTDWQPFQAEVDWLLPPEPGEHEVIAELRSGDLLVTSRDSILLLGSGKKSEPELGNLPDSLSFTYSLLDKELFPPSQELTPLNIRNNDRLSWKISLQMERFSASPLNGTTPDPFSILPAGLSGLSPGIYKGSLAVVVTNPQEVVGSPHTIQLELRVVSSSLHHIYAPLAVHSP
jgi:uncharacterized protein YkwD